MGNEQVAPAQALGFPCTGCGATLRYAPGQEAMVCPQCQTVNSLTQADEQARAVALTEHDYLAALQREAGSLPQQRVRVANCTACGAGVELVPPRVADQCPFCLTPLVLAQAHDEALIAPAAMLPFGIDEVRARAHFGRWLKGLWFAPNALLRLHRLEGGLRGVYLPYWTYDARAHTPYAGWRGEHYWETEYYSENGQRRSRQVRRTRWYPASGVVRDAFDDVLVPATRSLPHELLDELEPWPLEALQPYRGEYVSGFVAEAYQVGLESGFGRARERMNEAIASHVRRDIGGDEQRIDTMTPEFSGLHFKHILLPLWLAVYRFEAKTFRVAVNAVTGEVHGERPWSAWKISLAVLAVLLCVALVWWLGR